MYFICPPAVYLENYASYDIHRYNINNKILFNLPNYSTSRNHDLQRYNINNENALDYEHWDRAMEN